MSNSKTKQLFDLDLLSIPELPDVSDSLFLENEISQTEGEKYIVFLINEDHYAIASNKIAEVVRPQPFTTLPNFPDWLVGIANLRGDIISIIDLQILLKSHLVDSPKSRLIVLRSPDSDSHIAFKVDKVREIVTFPDNQVNFNKDIELPYLYGNINHKSNDIKLLNVDEILSSLKFN